jgi:hypothetical protein
VAIEFDADDFDELGFARLDDFELARFLDEKKEFSSAKTTALNPKRRNSEPQDKYTYMKTYWPKWRRKNLAKVRATMRQYYQRNKAKIVAAAAKFRAENRAKISAQRHAREDRKNPERKRRPPKLSGEELKRHRIETHRKWYAKNRKIEADKQKARDKRKRSAVQETNNASTGGAGC